MRYATNAINGMCFISSIVPAPVYLVSVIDYFKLCHVWLDHCINAGIIILAAFHININHKMQTDFVVKVRRSDLTYDKRYKSKRNVLVKNRYFTAKNISLRCIVPQLYEYNWVGCNTNGELVHTLHWAWHHAWRVWCNTFMCANINQDRVSGCTVASHGPTRKLRNTVGRLVQYFWCIS